MYLLPTMTDDATARRSQYMLKPLRLLSGEYRHLGREDPDHNDAYLEQGPEVDRDLDGDDESHTLLTRSIRRSASSRISRLSLPARIILMTGLSVMALPSLIIFNWLVGVVLGRRFTWAATGDIPLFPSIPWGSPGRPHRFEDDVVLTLRSGATVLYNRVPVHQLGLYEQGQGERAPMEYIPNRAFYSDADATLGPWHFMDILKTVSSEVKALDDFKKTYEEVQEYTSLRQDPAAVINHHAVSGNTAWQIDKWKFLPLHADAYRRWPDAKWHVAIEDDTWLLWNNLIKWLKTKPHDEQKFYGNQMWLVNGSVPFNHGGSGYVISRALMKATFGSDPDFEHKFDNHIRYSCCGDAELARAFTLSKPAVTLVKPSWEESGRSFRADSLDKTDINSNDWCQPIFTLHHVSPAEYVQLERFKRDVDPLVSQDDFIRFVDLWDYMSPRFLRHFSSPEQVGHHHVLRRGWRAIPAEDGGDEVPSATTAEACASECDRLGKECLVWTFEPKSLRKCRVSASVYIGTMPSSSKSSDDLESGWMLGRINAERDHQSCAGRLGELGELADADRGQESPLPRDVGQVRHRVRPFERAMAGWDESRRYELRSAKVAPL
ncbi:unnamed protein product [Jaminaea pallidilutea]